MFFTKTSIIVCPLGCGAEINATDEFDHITNECPKRKVSCNEGCDQLIQVDRLEQHLELCTYKKHTCGYGTSSCTYSMANWFYCNDIGNLHLTTCKKHRSNVIMKAVIKRETNLIKHIVNKSSTVLRECLSLETSHGDTVLTKASKLGYLEIVNLLIEKAMTLDHERETFTFTQFINHESCRGKTALIEASCNNHLEIVQTLLSYQASVIYKTKVHNQTALDWAHKLSTKEIINELLNAYKTEYRFNLLFEAISRGDLPYVKSMIHGGEKYRLNHLSVLLQEFEDLELQRINTKSIKERILESKEKKKDLNTIKDKLEIKDDNLMKKYKFESSHMTSFENDLKEDVLLMEKEQRKRKIILKKIEAARIMAFIAPSGHTLLSWACAMGNISIIQELLQRGATVGFGDDYLVLSARLIQISYRHHKWRIEHKEQNTEMLKRDLAFTCFLKQVKRITVFKRLLVRSPLCEAFYNGNGKILSVFHTEDIQIGLACMPTFVEPSGVLPRPFMYKQQSECRYKTSKALSFLECAYFGKETFEMANWIHGIGWVDSRENDSDKFNQSIRIAEVFQQDRMKEKVKIYEEKRKRQIGKQSERTRMHFECKMEHAISKGDFKQILYCANNNISINFQTNSGITPLMRAVSNENESSKYSICKNVAGEAISAVSMLLDRLTARPSIDYQSRLGHSALTYACYHGCLQSVQELLERGAKINQRIEKTGWTPLTVASMKGRVKIVQLLVNCGADISLKTIEGKDAFDYAIEGDSTTILELLENAKRGVIRRAHAGRDIYNTMFTCRWGCGFCACDNRSKYDHEQLCQWRIVPCKYCNIANLVAKDKHKHEAKDCEMRPCECTMCKRLIPLNQLADHTRNNCIKRLAKCSQCSMRVEAFRLQKHMKNFCEYRKISCRHFCGKVLPKALIANHEKQKCPNRSIRCLSCNTMLLARDKIKHDRCLCTEREVSCKFCEERLKWIQLESHLGVCTKRIVKCKNFRNGCNWFGPRKMLHKHLEIFCDYAFLNACPLGCKILLRKVDIECHINDICERRNIMCLVCGETIPYASFKSHLKFKCPMKLQKNIRDSMIILTQNGNSRLK